MQFSSFWKKYFCFWCPLDSKSSVYGKTHVKRNFTHNRARNHKHKELLVRSKVENTLLFIKNCPFSSNLAQLCALYSINYRLHHPHTLSKKNYMFHPNMKTCHFQTRKYKKTSKTSLKRQSMALLRSTISRCFEGPFLAEIEEHIEFDAIFFLLEKIFLLLMPYWFKIEHLRKNAF